jgi:hypothetical protein
MRNRTSLRSFRHQRQSPSGTDAGSFAQGHQSFLGRWRPICRESDIISHADLRIQSHLTFCSRYPKSY